MRHHVEVSAVEVSADGERVWMVDPEFGPYDLTPMLPYSDHWEPGRWALILSVPRLLEEVEE